MPTLDVKVKRYITQALACFDTPSQVIAAVKDEFGIDVPRQQVHSYDPTKVQGKNLSKELRELFDSTRARFISDVEAIPVAQQSYRLRQIQRLTEVALSRNNAALAAQLLEQAAKEVGGAFTNRREVGGMAGGPIAIAGKLEHVHALPDDELERIARGGSGA